MRMMSATWALCGLHTGSMQMQTITRTIGPCGLHVHISGSPGGGAPETRSTKGVTPLILSNNVIQPHNMHSVPLHNEVCNIEQNITGGKKMNRH
jgi:hypothetical protein